MSDYRQQNLELKIRDRLSVADAIALVHHLGVNKAAAFVSVVDPWRFPYDDAPATINVKGQVQSVVAKATFLGNTLSKFTDTSISAFLLSALLLKKGDRPSLVPKEARHLQKQLSLQLQPLHGNQTSIFQSLKVYTFSTFASPSPLIITPSLCSKTVLSLAAYM
jgi:hypothetical protein